MIELTLRDMDFRNDGAMLDVYPDYMNIICTEDNTTCAVSLDEDQQIELYEFLKEHLNK